MPKITKEASFVIFLCLGFLLGFFSNQLFNEKIYSDMYTYNGINLSLVGQVWQKVNENFVFQENIDSEAMVYGAIKGFVESLDDPYTVFFDPEEAKDFQEDIEGSFEGVGIQFAERDGKMKIIAPIKNTPAEKAGIRAGDYIIKVDEESVDNMSSEELVSKIRGEKGTSVVLTIQRDNEEKDFEITRDMIEVPASELSFIEENGKKIAYLQLFHFSENTSSEFNKEANEILQSNAESIILDLRNNPGGLVKEAQSIASWFIEKGYPVVIQKDKNGDMYKTLSSGPGTLESYPVAILINEGTASASEILVGALRDYLDKVVIIGENSFGKGLMQGVFYMDDGSILKMTTDEWYTPNMGIINEKGIEPDIAVEMTNEDYESENDPQLKRALEFLSQ